MKRSQRMTVTLAAVLLAMAIVLSAASNRDDPPNFRRPTNDRELRFWLENMVWHHGFSHDEIADATGMKADEIAANLKKFDIRRDTKPKRPADAPLVVMPYPGGRHPRIGFLDGAVRPQRETKFSVFAPWDDSSYVVVDLPEAIWSNLGLTYLAHTHVPTVWTKQKIELEPLEWKRRSDETPPGTGLDSERRLPNGVEFGAKVMPLRDAVRMELWLKNGSAARLADLRVQVCAMLKGAKGFDEQTNDNKVFDPPFAACRSADAKRWIILAFDHIHRAWGNPPCPCLHADPKFPDAAPGETKRVRGWISFFEGDDVKREFARIKRAGWLELPKD